MNEDIKKGDIYNVRIRVLDVDDDTGEITTDTVNENGQSLGFEWNYYGAEEAVAFTPINSENGNTEPSSKYDPCRLFRKGDRVQVKRRNGRSNGKYGEYLREAYCLVAEDEDKNELVRVFHNSSEYRLDPAYLKLITPVEELDPYYVEQQGEKTGGLCFAVLKRKGYAESTFYFGPCRSRTEQQAKQAAEAECARLNAAHRKDCDNA